MRKSLCGALLITTMLTPIAFTSCTQEMVKSTVSNVFNDNEIVGTWFLTKKSGYYSLQDGSGKETWEQNCSILKAKENSEIFQIKADNYYLIGGFADGEKFSGAGACAYANIGGVIKKLTLTSGIPTSFSQFKDCLTTYTVKEVSDSKLVLVLETTTEYQGQTYLYYEEKTYNSYSGSGDLLNSILSSIL